jgi:pyridoxamine 5'-phosphate oxidase
VTVGEDGPVNHDTPELAELRVDYRDGPPLAEDALAGDWLAQFREWLAAEVAAGSVEPNAMTLATADPAGRPSARTVLLKRVDERGFVCFTNLRSRKATEALANPYASLVFRWPARHRQVVVCGSVAQLTDRAEVGAYFAARPRGGQLGAWASPQSRVVASRADLDEAYAAAAARFPDPDRPVPPPPHWGGLRVVPQTVEFWQGRADRMHDRLRFRLRDDGGWAVERLAP